jgi:hypothetical protein
MKEITISSGMDSFVMVDSIREAGPEGITAVKALQGAPAFAGIESLAQAAALHTRYLSDFLRHAFLLKIQGCSLPASGGLDGEFVVRGVLKARSASTFLYAMSLEKEGRTIMEGDFLIGTVEYDGRFRKDVLEQRYREVFSCLLTASRPG